MIQIKRTRHLSAKVIAQFTPHSQDEWRRMKPLRDDFYRRARGLWVLYYRGKPLCVIAMQPTSWLGTGAEVFFLLCKAAQQYLTRLIKFLVRAFRHAARCFGRIVVAVEDGFWIGERFVAFFGFRQYTDVRELAGVHYRTYELRASWL